MFEKDEAYYRQRLQEIADREENNQPNPSSVISGEDALKYGLLKEEDNIQDDTVQEDNISEYTETAPENEERFQKLSLGQSVKDLGKSVGAEALHFVQPRAYETQYESQTKLGHTAKELYKWGAGIAGFMLGGEVIGGALAGIKGASMAVKGANAIGKGLQTLLSGKNLIKTGKNATKAAKMWAKIANGAWSGLAADVLANFTLYNSEEDEGHLADIFGETDNKFISLLQTKPDDTEFDARMKNAVETAVLDIPLGATLAGILQTPVKNLFKGIHGTLHAKTAEEASEALADTARAKIALENVTNTLDLVNEVDKLIKEAEETGEEVSQLIIDRMPPTKLEEARAIAGLRQEGEEIFPYSDGTWSIKINNWQDAYKVTPEQYAEQLKTLDETGNTAISQMNEAIESVWRERGLIDGGGLLNGTAKEITNTANAVLKYYKNKFGFGKTKINLKFGDWANIPDGKTARYDNGDIFIQINSTSKDIYAALRSELEHARDLVKGEVPKGADVKGSGEHFARYKGDNEAEIAPYYVRKKAAGRAEKTQAQKEITDIQTNVKQYETDGYKFEDTPPKEGTGEKRYELKDGNGNNLGFVEYTVKDDVLDIGQVTNTTKRKI